MAKKVDPNDTTQKIQPPLPPTPKPPDNRLSAEELEEIRVFADGLDQDSGPHRPDIQLQACTVLLLHELVVSGRK